MEAEFTSRKLWFRVSVRGLKLGGSRNLWGGARGDLPDSEITTRTLRSSTPQKYSSICCQLRLGAKGGRAPVRLGSPGQIAFQCKWGQPDPPPPTHQIRAAPATSHNGPASHVVDGARQYEPPPPLPAPGQVGGWSPEAQHGVFLRFPLRTETGEVRRAGGC